MSEENQYHQPMPEGIESSLAVSDQQVRVIVFTKDGCNKCDRTKEILDGHEIVYEAINVEHDLEPRKEFGGLSPFDYVTQTCHVREMPYVEVQNHVWGDAWSGMRYDKLVELNQKIKA